MIDENTALQLFLNRLLSRSSLGGAEQNDLLALSGECVTFQKRRDFPACDGKPKSVDLVVSGIVAQFLQRRHGVRQITALFVPGDVVNLQSVVSQSTMGGFTALSDVRTLRISHSSLRSLMLLRPAIAEALWRDTIRDQATLVQWMTRIGRQNARSRLAHFFCEMAVRLSDDSCPTLKFALPLPQDQIADAVSMTPVHLNRCLKELRPLLMFASGTVQIVDWDALAALGEFDPRYLSPDGFDPVTRAGAATALTSTT